MTNPQLLYKRKLTIQYYIIEVRALHNIQIESVGRRISLAPIISKSTRLGDCSKSLKTLYLKEKVGVRVKKIDSKPPSRGAQNMKISFAERRRLFSCQNICPFSLSPSSSRRGGSLIISLFPWTHIFHEQGHPPCFRRIFAKMFPGQEIVGFSSNHVTPGT